jgi:hypothetical protein
MDLKTIRELDIAMSTIYYAPQGIQVQEGINYSKWVKYIDLHQDYFTWAENTEEGKEILANIDLLRFLDMANFLDAYLLNNGIEIIDEKVLNSLM